MGNNYSISEMNELISSAKNGLGLLDDNTPTMARLAREVDVDRVTLYRWMNGDIIEPVRSRPIKKLEVLAEFWEDHVKRTKEFERELVQRMKEVERELDELS